MENKWAYSILDELWWDSKTFDSKEEAIQEARKEFQDGCLLGQLYVPDGASSNQFSVKVKDKAYFNEGTVRLESGALL